MAESGKSGVVRPIIIGVATTVLTAVILYYLNLGGNNGDNSSQTAVTSAEDQQRIDNLEKQINALSQDQLEQKQREFDALMRSFQQDVQQASSHSNGPLNLPGQPHAVETESLFSHIGGVWRNPGTGVSYRIVQNGNAFSIEEVTVFGATAAGSGRMVGRNGTFSYRNFMGAPGSGRLSLSHDGSNLTLTFTDHTTQLTMSTLLQR